MKTFWQTAACIPPTAKNGQMIPSFPEQLWLFFSLILLLTHWWLWQLMSTAASHTLMPLLKTRSIKDSVSMGERLTQLAKFFFFIFFWCDVMFVDKLWERYREQFMAPVSEGHLTARTEDLDAAGTASWSMATAIAMICPEYK